MREIKFRGKRIDTGEWVYGYYCYGMRFKKNYIADDVDGDVYEVDPTTVGQYTGLKDKNGKEIYEGDIILTIDEDESACIAWDEDVLCWEVVFSSYSHQLGEYPPHDIEVIGNIHDNPTEVKA